MDKLIVNLRNIVATASVFDCYAINTKKHPVVGTKIDLSNEQLSEFMKDATDYLCSKRYNKKQLGSYPVASPKDYIEILPCADEQIKSFIDSIEKIPFTPELNATDLKYYNAYFILLYCGNRKHFFITKKNLFTSYKAKYIYIPKKEAFQRLSDKLVHLVRHFDAFTIDDNCYIVTDDGKFLLGLERDLVKKSNATKDELFERNILPEDDQDIVEAYMKKSGKAKCFAGTDENILRELESIAPENKDVIANKYRLPIRKAPDGNFYIDVRDEEKLKNFIDTVTCRRCLDFNNHVVGCAAPFTPRL